MREVREAAGHTKKGIVIAPAVLLKLEKLWGTEKGTTLKQPFHTLLRILTSVMTATSANNGSGVGQFVGQGFCFHVEREGDNKYRIVDITVSCVLPRPHKHSPDMDINRVTFPDRVLRQFATDHLVYCASYLTCPYLAACNILAQANESYGCVLRMPQGPLPLRITREGKKQHRVFSTHDWRFLIIRDGKRFIVESIHPVNSGTVDN